MNFKKLEVFGFKSFADKLEVKFDNGITGIVGPNGCGKSNVADSIRWVLGEQSAKLLRGSNMMDVIFNGTERRKALSYCEVSLYFDNTRRIFPIEYDEIVISRKLYRSGESEYSLNKSVCRLKDIVDILRDGGIGREGYSIIGQGRIDELLSAKPEDRRAIFEEACGISKFKARRTETERKLTRTHDNLIRLNDILSEIEKQLSPLQSQSENAKIYLELKEKLKHHEINNYICQFESVNSTKNAIENRLAGINEATNLKTGEYNKAVSDYDNRLAAINNTDIEIGNLRNNQLYMTVGLEKQSGELKLLRERIAMLTSQNERLIADIKESKERKDQLSSELDTIRTGKETKQSDYEMLLAESDKFSTDFLKLVEKISLGEDQAELTQQMVIESMQRLTEIKSSLSSLITEKNVIADKRSELIVKASEIKIELNKALELGKDITENSKTVAQNREERNTLRRKLAEEYNAAIVKMRLLSARISEDSNRLSSLKTKLNYLISARDNFEGYNQSVKQLLNSAAKDGKIASQMEGAVARLIEVPERYETALDVALGQAMQNIVTRTQEQAKFLINYLKQNRLGRVTFLPMDAIKARDIDSYTERKASEINGYIGVASKLVNYDSKYYNIVSGLLGKTIICEDLDSAVEISKAINYSVKIVSLDGDIIHPFGAMTGGSQKTVASNLLSYDNDIKEAEEQIILTDKRLTTSKEEHLQAEELSQKVFAEGTKVGEEVHKYDIEIAKFSEQVDKYSKSVDNFNKELSSINLEIQKIDDRLSFIESELKTADELELKLTRQKDGADGSRVEQREQYDDLRKQRDKLHDKTTSIKIRLAELQSSMSADRENETRITLELKNIERDISAAQGVLEINNASIDVAEREKLLVNINEEDERQLQEIKDKLGNLDLYKQQLQQQMASADKLKTELSSELQRLSESRIKEESLYTKVEVDLENMKNRIWEEYEITYETAITYREEEYEFAKSNGEISRLKRQIGALGFVNVNAIEDYKILKERFDELDTQVKDLEKAEEDLRKIISDLTTEMLTRFTKGFNDINTNFTRVFKELFGGGNAKLVLDTTETADPLSAGIDIVAEPPGKKLQSISLLSGGERALTAIAILFAILKLRPMPFCVLDEIEAALDDANALRFASYLKNFSKETQFIVITHRKPTMELSDALYGVTMQEKGVSKIVSVRLSEALSSIETA